MAGCDGSRIEPERPEGRGGEAGLPSSQQAYKLQSKSPFQNETKTVPGIYILIGYKVKKYSEHSTTTTGVPDKSTSLHLHFKKQKKTKDWLDREVHTCKPDTPHQITLDDTASSSETVSKASKI